MTLARIPDFHCLLMMEGVIYGNLKDNARSTPRELHLGGARSLFAPSAQAPIDGRDAAIPFTLSSDAMTTRITSEPTEEKAGDIFACWVNHLPDWSMNGSQTIQLMIHQFDASCRITFKDQLTVTNLRKGMRFETQLAIHRAKADLVISFSDPSNDLEEHHRIAFDPAFKGGLRTSGYLPVSIPLPDHFESCDVALAVDYHQHLPDDTGTEPFMFIAGTQITPDHVAKINQTSAVPCQISGEAMANGSTWISAPLPTALTPGQAISVNVDGKSFPVTPMQNTTFFVRENFGHTLICQSEEELDLILSIDGRYIKTLQIGINDTVIRLPDQFLDGHVHLVCITDISGSVTLFKSQQLVPAIVTPAAVMQHESVAPFPAMIFAQTAQRYDGLKKLIGTAKADTDLAQVAHALKTVEGGHETVKLEPLTFPHVDRPDVSIIIPAHNKVEVTYLALCSLLIAPNRASFEVIVVDDASTDETAELEKIVTGINVIHNETPQRFIRACNAGAEQARGRFVALLNNDVEVTAGWLDALIDAFDRFDNVGLAGSKLLNPDGTLQDAGGIVWGSGNPWNYGNAQNPHEPRFGYARQADYLSGAALMLPKKLWNKIGGLSSYLEPMYFEDTDLAFKVREAGYSTWFVPSSQVYHFEGMTSGTDVSTGFKKYQEVNRPKFKRCWARAFGQFGTEGIAPDLEKDRGIVGRVLFIDYAPPRPDKDAGSYAALQEMKLVQSLGYKVTFMSTNMAHLGSYTEDLQRQGIEVIYAPFFMNADEYLTKHAQDFDAFFLTRYYVAQTVLPTIRAHAPGARILFNNADLHFLRELRAAQRAGDLNKLESARRVRTEELDVIKAVDVVLSYTEVEHSVIEAYTDGQARIVKCPWVVDRPKNIPGLGKRRGLSFLGSFKHHPNTEGIKWFAKDVMPLLDNDSTAPLLTIYGSGMGEDIRALASDLILPHGFVENASDAFHAHRIFVAPLLSGAGIKGKVISALAHGIPTVLTPIAAEGIGLRSGLDCIIAQTSEEWRSAIAALSVDDELWQRLSSNGQNYVADTFSFDRGRSQMRIAFEAADLFGARP
ncbi:glycosyltransferase [Sulfitobacter mediterraneus]|uniref:glycosyltransferase n=1 Tax=Sulfitobacter mediterraneus TaxID=83219 RepID=UPI00193A8793|nr:glycosyltransferase [Sulfitobacter mediterraneus]MBM1555327.1 glycosyltransferase [Sulfitobacter mediterraneus]MBM1567120.1 glycosyltransferase [Sulfitobacter mediterraneus]MBM1570922.1 glycosyltransferase [Sulfitobacter mediterraneus]MBM1574722.1 glycosyltransferase [Sulfitobacter mediterraneus]MBM1578285.1 glycosyltransferase [Sulfitobacter mediterraneus]